MLISNRSSMVSIDDQPGCVSCSSSSSSFISSSSSGSATSPSPSPRREKKRVSFDEQQTQYFDSTNSMTDNKVDHDDTTSRNDSSSSYSGSSSSTNNQLSASSWYTAQDLVACREEARLALQALQEAKGDLQLVDHRRHCFRGIEKFGNVMAKMQTQRILKESILKQQRQILVVTDPGCDGSVGSPSSQSQHPEHLKHPIQEQQPTVVVRTCPEQLAVLSRYLSQPSRELAYRFALMNAAEGLLDEEQAAQEQDDSTDVDNNNHNNNDVDEDDANHSTATTATPPVPEPHSVIIPASEHPEDEGTCCQNTSTSAETTSINSSKNVGTSIHPGTVTPTPRRGPVPIDDDDVAPRTNRPYHDQHGTRRGSSPEDEDDDDDEDMESSSSISISSPTKKQRLCGPTLSS